MKTIKERAKEYSLKDFDGYHTGGRKQLKKAILPGQKSKSKLIEYTLKNGIVKRYAINEINANLHLLCVIG